ncbi:MAG: hypothetical protein ACOH2V_13920 [Candidatus Saccharimonadaceae bacterium]
MNYSKHLSVFFERAAKDSKLNPTHVSLYMSLFHLWNYDRPHVPISISRLEIMKTSKIASKATYHKCLKALHEHGYIKYKPSFNPFVGSQVFIIKFPS